ncbi:MAG: hypothetical protein F4Z15_06825 [Gammaproteobacteria bacterium]|nr:hypothetical protein [Gammaproteobacteria bacterium]MYD75147.1 hypothetical protein [Gammaproteobacteria bacterium]MYJ53018.1 hypothetical protein [Gammaproteobacteria bacterium]
MDISSDTIEEALRRLPELPTPVSSWHVETGPDSTDDPAVWVWTMLEDDEVELDKRLQLRSLIRDRVAKEVGTSMIVYIRFRGASEVEQEV